MHLAVITVTGVNYVDVSGRVLRDSRLRPALEVKTLEAD
jgi:hypothetical protein